MIATVATANFSAVGLANQLRAVLVERFDYGVNDSPGCAYPDLLPLATSLYDCHALESSMRQCYNAYCQSYGGEPFKPDSRMDGGEHICERLNALRDRINSHIATSAKRSA